MPERREQEFEALTPEMRTVYKRELLVKARGGWTSARKVRRRAVSGLERIASLPLNAEQAKRCANQVKKLRKELEDVESKLRGAAEE